MLTRGNALQIVPKPCQTEKKVHGSPCGNRLKYSVMAYSCNSEGKCTVTPLVTRVVTR